MKTAGKYQEPFIIAVLFFVMLLPLLVHAQHRIRFKTGTEYYIYLVSLSEDSIKYRLYSDYRIQFTVPMEDIDSIFRSPTEIMNDLNFYLPDEYPGAPKPKKGDLNYSIPDYRKYTPTLPPDKKLKSYRRMMSVGGTLVSIGIFVASYISIEGVPNIYMSGPFFVVGGTLGLAGLVGEARYKKQLNRSSSLEIRMAPEVGGVAIAIKF